MQYSIPALALFFSITLSLTACSKKSGAAPPSGPDTLVTTAPANPIGITKPHGGDCCLISNTNDATKLIEVYDPADSPWTTPKWSWKPTVALGFTPDVQLHGVELLPGGNCLVANADPANGYFAIIASSQAGLNNDMVYTTYRAPSAHAVLWDSSHNCVWALSDTLLKYTVGGTPENPALTLVSRYNLPTRWGHDLSAYTTDGNLMWVSTNSGTYIFNKTDGGFRAVAGDAQGTFVKGLSDLPGKNLIVESRQDPTGCTLDGWCTKTIRFFDLGTGNQTGTRTVNTAAFYKSKSWDPSYY